MNRLLENCSEFSTSMSECLQKYFGILFSMKLVKTWFPPFSTKSIFWQNSFWYNNGNHLESVKIQGKSFLLLLVKNLSWYYQSYCNHASSCKAIHDLGNGAAKFSAKLTCFWSLWLVWILHQARMYLDASVRLKKRSLNFSKNFSKMFSNLPLIILSQHGETWITPWILIAKQNMYRQPSPGLMLISRLTARVDHLTSIFGKILPNSYYILATMEPMARFLLRSY